MEGLKTGAGEGAAALDQIAESLDNLDFKKVAEGNENLVQVQRALADELKALKDQAAENIAVSQKLLKHEKIRGKTAQQISHRQAKAMAELNKLMELEGKNRAIGVRELQKFVKATMEVNKELQAERRLLRENQMGAARWAANQKRMLTTWAKATERIDEAAEGFDKITDKLGADYLGAGLMGGVQGMVQRRFGEGGRGGKGAVAGMAAFAGMAALLGKLMGVRRETADVLSPKAFNYGYQGFTTLSGAIQATTKDVAEFTAQARQLGVEGDAARQIFTEVGKETGETNKNLLKAAKPTFRAIQAGIINTGEAASILTERINTVGMSAYDASREIELMGLVAKSTGKVQMEDLYKSVQNVAQASGALVTSQLGLAKSMAAVIKQGDKLGLSYNRRLKAAEGLNQALTSGYNQGFATIEIEEDLAMAMNARSRITKGTSKGERDRLELLSKQAEQIAQMRESGMITDVRAAEMLTQIGARTEEGAIQERMRRAAIDLQGPGGFEMAVARLGDLTFDQAAILQEVGKQLGEGKTMAEIMKAGITKEAADEYMRMQEEFGALKYTGKGLMETTLDDLMSNLSSLLSPILDALPGVLKDITWTIKWLQKKFGVSKEDIKRQEAEKAAEAKREALSNTQDTLNLMLTEATGRKMSWAEEKLRGKEAPLRDLIESGSMQEKFRKKFQRGFREPEKEAILAAVGDDAALRAKAQEMFKAMETGQFKKVQVTPGRMRPDGSQGVEVTLSGDMNNAAKDAQTKANMVNEGARQESRFGP